MSNPEGQPRLSELMPKDWRDRYDDVKLVKSSEEDHLVGVKGDITSPKLKWDRLDENIRNANFEGVDIDSEQEPAEGTWNHNGGRIVVTGIKYILNADHYVLQGSGAYIPTSEVSFTAKPNSEHNTVTQPKSERENQLFDELVRTRKERDDAIKERDQLRADLQEVRDELEGVKGRLSKLEGDKSKDEPLSRPTEQSSAETEPGRTPQEERVVDRQEPGEKSEKKVETGPDGTGTETTTVTKTPEDNLGPRYRYRPTFGERIRKQFGWGEPLPEYYYFDDNGRRFYVIGDERVLIEENSGGGALAIGAAVLSLVGIAYIAHEVEEIEHRQPTIERIDESLSPKIVDQVDKHIDEKIGSVQKQLKEPDDKNTRQHAHINKHQSQSLHNRSYRENETVPGNNFPYRYQWDWSRTIYGYDQAEPMLHELGQRAAADGHNVRWMKLPHGKEVMVLDGTLDTQRVTSVLNQYR